MIEWLGYAASALVAVSLMMKDLVRLRVLNLIGCVLFVIYGAVIGAWPIVLANGFIVGVNGYYLWRIGRYSLQGG